MTDTQKSKIREYIVENFLFGRGDGLRDDSSFLDEGIIDSTGVLELVGYLEQEFAVTVEDDELVPENLNSINNLAVYIDKKVAA